MGGSTTKKVLVRRFDREPLAGYINPQSYLRPAGVELLTPDGGFTVVPYLDVKMVSFVRDFDALEIPDERKVFNTRPKVSGLWVRMTFRDRDILEGVLTNNLLLLETHGFTVVPPDPSSKNQRIFAPRTALTEVQVLGVVGSPLRKPKAKPAPKEQIELFER